MGRALSQAAASCAVIVPLERACARALATSMWCLVIISRLLICVGRPNITVGKF